MFHDESKPIFADYTLYGRDSISGFHLALDLPFLFHFQLGLIFLVVHPLHRLDLSMAVSFLRPSLRESNNGNYLALGNRGSILLKFSKSLIDY